MRIVEKIIALVMGCSLLTPMGMVSAEDARWQDRVPKYKEIKGQILEKGPILLFSDSPEMVNDCGVMYRDTVQGKVRLFFHHVNDTDSTKQLALVLRNKNFFRPAVITVGRQGISKANKDWLRAGKEAQVDFFTKEQSRTFRLRGKKEFFTGKTGIRIHPQELITGIVDFEFSKPIEVSFMMLPLKTDFNDAFEMYGILPPDQGGHILRGTFPASDKLITINQVFDTDKNEVWGIKLADGEHYVKGTDVTRKKPVVDYGDYGVVYDLKFKTTGSKATRVRFNPYGGVYAGYCDFYAGDKLTRVLLPKETTAFGEKNHDEGTIVLGDIPAGKEGRIVFSPPGSSNLPVRIFLEPVHKQVYSAKIDK